MVGAQEVGRVGRRELVLEPLEVVDIAAERGDPVADASGAEVAVGRRVGGVERRLVGDRDGRNRVPRVVEVVELEVEVQGRRGGPEPVENGDAADLLLRAAGRWRGVDVDGGVVLIDTPVAERSVDQLARHWRRRQLDEVLIDVEVRVGKRPGLVRAVLDVLPQQVHRTVAEEVVLEDRAADAEAGTKARALLGVGRILAVGLEGGRLVFDARLSVEVVRSGLRDAVDDEASGAAVFGRHATAREADFLDVELGEVLVGVAEKRVRDVDAVVEERVVLAAATGVDADVRVGDRDAGVRDSGSKLERTRERAIQRQLLQLRPRGHVGDAALLRVDEGSRGGHRHLFGGRGVQDRADFRVLDGGHDHLLLERSEALQLSPQLVRARGEVQELEGAVRAGGRGAAEGHLRTRDRDEDSGKRGSRRVARHARDGARRLGEGEGSEKQENEDTESPGSVSMHAHPPSKKIRGETLESNLEGFYDCSSRMKSSKVSRRRESFASPSATRTSAARRRRL